MKKKKSKLRSKSRWEDEDVDRLFDAFLEDDDSEDSTFDERSMDDIDDVPRFHTQPKREYSFRKIQPDFDFDRWRDDLIERASNRERMRQRDRRRGIL